MRIMGRTHDDAAGEAFDKTARLLGLPYPAAPSSTVSLAREFEGLCISSLSPRRRRARFLVLRIENVGALFLESEAGREAAPADVAASFQAAVVDALMTQLQSAFKRLPTMPLLSPAASPQTRRCVRGAAWSNASVPVFIPPPKYCTDNAAMIAAAAFYQKDATRADPLSMAADPNLPFALTERAGHT